MIYCRPQCPQPPSDVEHLLRLPPGIVHPALEENEFKCLNLNITCPPTGSGRPIEGNLLPVMIWIHGRFSTMAPEDLYTRPESDSVKVVLSV